MHMVTMMVLPTGVSVVVLSAGGRNSLYVSHRKACNADKNSPRWLGGTVKQDRLKTTTRASNVSIIICRSNFKQVTVPVPVVGQEPKAVLDHSPIEFANLNSHNFNLLSLTEELGLYPVVSPHSS